MKVALAVGTLVRINPDSIASVELREAITYCGTVCGRVLKDSGSGICRVALEAEIPRFSFIDRDSGNPCLDIHRMHLDVI